MNIQDRIGALEAEAKGRLRHVLNTGNERLMELDAALGKLSKDDWTVPGIRRHLDEWVSRAEAAGQSAMKRAQEMPGEAVTRLAENSRAPLQTLAKGLADMAKRLEPEAQAGKDGAAPKPE